MKPNARDDGLATRDKLVLEAAKEFARNGYENTSLRKVCTEAGVTTGALYFFFKNKESLFRTVVEPITEPLAALLVCPEGGSPVFLLAMGDRAGTSPEVREVRAFLDLCYRRRLLVLAMVKNRESPVMEELLGEMRSRLEVGIRALVAQRADCPKAGQEVERPETWDDFVVGWLADAMLRSLMEVLAADESLDDARRHLGLVAKFMCEGIRTLR